MKKLAGIVLAVLLTVSFATTGFAAKGKKADGQKFDRIVASVVSLDVAAKTIVVKEEKTGASRTISISAKAASQLKVGDRVRIKLKAGTDESAGVRVLKAEAPVEAPVDATVDAKAGAPVEAVKK
ncbi:MAG: hypothetical protein WCO69_06715 [Candidatus Omnitrophota bacterium]